MQLLQPQTLPVCFMTSSSFGVLSAFLLLYTFRDLILSYLEPRLMTFLLPMALVISSFSRVHCSFDPGTNAPYYAMVIFIQASFQT